MKTPIVHPSAGYSANTTGSERLMEAVRAYIAAFSSPSIPIKNVIPADTNFRTLPAGTNDYAVFFIQDQENVGTPIEKQAPDGSTVIGVYVRCRVQVDVYSDAGTGYDNARSRAQTLSTIARTPTGVGFFDRYGIDCLFSDFASNCSGITDAKINASRWSLTLNLGFWQWIAVNQDYFTDIADNVQNVDVAFHP